MTSWFKKLFGGSAAASTPLSEIRRSFDEAAADEEHFPSTIDPRIYHVKLIQEYFGDLSHRNVLDVGCGKGRFAKVLKQAHPSANLIAVDLSEAMLRFIPNEISVCSATMTHLPIASQSIDCIYATESLEHAVQIDVAVKEMCRVLKPGGKLVIIDKNAEQWGKLKTPEWEKWFRRDELEKLLRRDCNVVSSRYISYWEDVEPDGLFLAWLAQK